VGGVDGVDKTAKLQKKGLECERPVRFLDDIGTRNPKDLTKKGERKSREKERGPVDKGGKQVKKKAAVSVL